MRGVQRGSPSGAGPADAVFALVPHRDAGFEIGEVDDDADPFDCKPDRARQVVESDRQDAGVVAGRVRPDVAQPAVERPRELALGRRTCQRRRVLRSTKLSARAVSTSWPTPPGW
jgi:hypothetical protein